MTYNPLTGVHKEDGDDRVTRQLYEYTQSRKDDTMDQKMEALRKQVAALQASMGSISSNFVHFNEDLAKLVTRSEFYPVKYIVFGACFSMLAGVVFYILSRVLLK